MGCSPYPVDVSSNFQTLPLRNELFEALEQVGYAEMTAIQSEALPAMLKGQDVIGQAKTGSGKTAAFGLALLNGIDLDEAAPQALVLCPTRELAEQVAEEIRRLAQRLPNLRVVSLCGGRPSRDQVQALKGGCHVVVGTPGRVAKHQRKRDLDLRSLRVLVLDEADRMLDMGFIDQVVDIIAPCSKDRQTLLFSATFPDQIAQLSATVQRRPFRVEVASQVEADLLQQLVFHCERGLRWQTVANLLAKYRPETALVFCETRDDCDRLVAFLKKKGASAFALHGQMEQRDREDVLLQFGNGSASVLVSTNVASRGLDIPALPMVIIAELSPDPENHLHRIGRTGRAGEQGLAVSVVSGEREHARLKETEAYMMQSVPEGPELDRAQRLEFLQPPNRTLLILSGRKDKLRKGDVLGSLVKDGKIPPDAIGRIDLMQRVCGVAVARAFAKQALQHVREGRIKKKRVRAQLL